MRHGAGPHADVRFLGGHHERRQIECCQTARQVLDTADAAVVVLAADPPASVREMDLLSTDMSVAAATFVVLNKADLTRPASAQACRVIATCLGETRAARRQSREQAARLSGRVERFTTRLDHPPLSAKDAVTLVEGERIRMLFASTTRPKRMLPYCGAASPAGSRPRSATNCRPPRPRRSTGSAASAWPASPRRP